MPTRAIIRAGEQPRHVEITDAAEIAELDSRRQAHDAKVVAQRKDERDLTPKQLFRKRWQQRLQDSPAGPYKHEIRNLARQKMASDAQLTRQQALSAAVDDIIEDEWRERGERVNG